MNLKKPSSLSLSLSVALLASVSASIAWAKPIAKWNAPALPAFEETGFDAGQIGTVVQAVRNARRPANDGRTLSEADLKPDFKAMRDRLLRVKTADELHQILVEMDREENFQQYSTDLKYFAAQAVLLMPYRSIVFRLRPVLEHNKTVQSSAVTTLKSLAAGLKIYLPTEQWDAGFEYVTAPSADDATNTQFRNISDFQKALVERVAPVFVKAARRLQALNRARLEAPIVWDNKLLYGPGTFEDSLDRYVAHNQAELAATLSFIHMGLHTAYSFSAYFQDDLPDLAYDLGRLAGLDGFRSQILAGSAGELGVTAEDRTRVVRGRKYANYLVIYPEFGARLMDRALQHLKASITYMDAAWKSLAEGESNIYAILNPADFGTSRRVAEARLRTMKAMVEGKTAVRSAVTGEVVEIDLPAFFKQPTSDLKTLLPTGFDNGPLKRTVRGSSGRDYEYRNYFRGRATGWDRQAWQKALPNGDDIPKALRILSQSWGGDYLSPILASVIL